MGLHEDSDNNHQGAERNYPDEKKESQEELIQFFS